MSRGDSTDVFMIHPFLLLSAAVVVRSLRLIDPQEFNTGDGVKADAKPEQQITKSFHYGP
jgi:hypothetical protein